jgi:HlyD family secretion protein
MSMKTAWMVCFGTLAVVGLSSCGKKGADEPKGRMVAAGPVTLRDAVRLSGTVQPVVQVELKAEVSGRILRLPVLEGAAVKRGDLLVQIDPEPFQLKVDRAQLVVDRARLALSIAKRDLSRTKVLIPTGTVSSDAVEDLETALSRAELDLRDAQLQAREARKDLANAQLRAPMDGRLISLAVEEGEMVASAISANGGTDLGVVADPSKMMVEVEVGELDFPRLRLGMPVEISTGSEGARPRKGTVTFVSSSARASTASSSIQVFPVEVTLDADSAIGNERSAKGDGKKDSSVGARKSARVAKDEAASVASSLVSGMTVGVDFVFLEREVPVAVPTGAIKKGKDGGVQVRDADGKIVVRKVRTGATDFRNTEILEGLQAGDSVLVAETSQKTGAAGMGGPR